ncbi:Zn-ribbon domain-containing OB-fold protein [Halopolyspora algeriensis]|uniref:Zn-ribbon domain-containing OB-fold protein n=1 Tax=Halopolyspora algeriensis TaxID=1500506 RepID=UPI000DF246FE|nr:OB-fold nucleic acid binding domain-containing protein [Halopolyspora algeriensis]
MSEPLSAPLEVGFDYTRSLGPVLGRFATALRQRRIEGVRGSDGRVHVPVVEYDPITAEALDDFVEVGQQGTVLSWSWTPHPLEGQPLAHAFAWALIRLDGADTPLLHAVDVVSPQEMHTGMRVRVRWSDAPVGSIRDIACFDPVPDDAAAGGTAADHTGEAPPLPESTSEQQEPVAMTTTPVHLHYRHSASPEESQYLRALAEGRLIGQRCPACGKVYIPPRGACPTDGVPTTDEIELPDAGTVTTFCIVNVPFLGQRIKPPYVAAYVLLDGADIPFLHLVLGCAAEEVRMGMRVRAAWKSRDQWGTTLENIDHFEPTGEPDAPYESYARHL